VTTKANSGARSLLYGLQSATIEEAGEVLHIIQVEPGVSDTPLKGPVFTRVFEEFLLLYPRLHPY
jgi:hypothetical protein